MSGLGGLLDAAACGISGHIWVVNSGIDGTMVCSRCGAQEDAPPPPENYDPDADDSATSLVPEHRPWLDPPYTVSE